MEVTSLNNSAGVSVRFSHVCGHASDALHYAGREFADFAQARQEANVCLRCQNQIALADAAAVKEREEAVARGWTPEHRLFTADPNPELPQPGDYYVGLDYSDQLALVRLEQDPIGQYWVRWVPDRGVVFQSWIRDQEAVANFFARRKFKRVPNPFRLAMH